MEPRALYSEAYAAAYRALYVDHPMWHAKHAMNLGLVRALVPPGGRWLDACCGQAWHFTQVAGVAKTGVDLSPAQLARARRDNPDARFLEADVLAAELGERFDLVTSFWGAYAYLDDHARIAAFVARGIEWTAPGGALYLELLTPDTLAAFNATAFADQTASAVEIRGALADGVAWSFHDPGGRHDLTCPSIGFFERALAPWFHTVEVRGVVATMAQLVAVGRTSERMIDRSRERVVDRERG